MYCHILGKKQLGANYSKETHSKKWRWDMRKKRLDP